MIRDPRDYIEMGHGAPDGGDMHYDTWRLATPDAHEDPTDCDGTDWCDCPPCMRAREAAEARDEMRRGR